MRLTSPGVENCKGNWKKGIVIKMKIKRFMIAAPKSGSGKTIVTCALLQIMKGKGWRVSSCKCGPDYIDPMFHEKVIGVPAKNLDTFFTSEEDTRKLFADSVEENSIVVLEGVMGLYDGLGGNQGRGFFLSSGKSNENANRACR